MADAACSPCNTTSKKSPKKEKAPKEARKLGRLQKKNNLISRWAQTDSLFNTCLFGLQAPGEEIRCIQIFRSRRFFFWRRQRITVPIPKHAAAICVVSTSISMLHFHLQQCCTIGDMVLSCLVLTSHALRASH